MTTDVRYARSGGLSIAYQVLGQGPPDVVFIPGFISHLELNWDSPLYRPLMERISRFARLVIFDKRGTGLSDRSLGSGSVEDRMDDVRAVMDAAGIEQATLFAVSEGGPLAMTFAATYPDRVAALALYGTFALGTPEEPPPGVTAEALQRTREQLARFPDLLEATWNTGRALRFIVQHAPATEEVDAFLARFERNSCTPAAVAEIMRNNLAMDVRAVLPLIRCPTLVMHTSGDPLVHPVAGRHLADHIPGARLVEVPGDFHVSWNPDQFAPVLEALEEFVVGHPLDGAAAPADRVLATVLFTDIVGSTEQAVSLGDRRWRELLDRHDDLARRRIGEYGGRLVKTTGDGVLATFDGPARAIRCATAMRDGSGPLGLAIRAGIHTGEVEVRQADVGGVAVHIGARVSALAGPGEILVSRTVKDLVVGSGLGFSDRGSHQLKGLPDEWQVYAVTS
ncbi:MAG TPA: adenylate/guanylate cyclase domain-containing protein [Acidimicrobiales bacterium]|nr:adenylate/guanylate cyclase domain-containing protein [Acidimicrobiales bacterium]